MTKGFSHTLLYFLMWLKPQERLPIFPSAKADGNEYLMFSNSLRQSKLTLNVGFSLGSPLLLLLPENLLLLMQ